VQVRGSRPPPTLIIIWSGAVDDIPEGWVLCDGTNATPDMRDRFVVGTTYEIALDSADRTYGQASNSLSHAHGITIENESGHTHTVDVGALGRHAYYSSSIGGLGTPGGGSYIGAHEHSISGNATPGGSEHGHSGGSGPSDAAEYEQRPPWYALAYVMGQGNVPVGGMALVYLGTDPYGWYYDEQLEDWVEGASPLPAGYVLCDGDNDTPYMGGYYVVGAGPQYMLLATYGGDGFAVADHEHDEGDVALVAESDHQHEWDGVDHGPTFTSVGPATMAQGTPVTFNGTSYSPVTHNHNPRFDIDGTPREGSLITTQGGSHGHVISGVASEAYTYSYGESDTDPLTYVLHWVKRVS